MIRKEGRIVPSVAMRQPFNPRNLFPINMDIFTANTPGNDCAMASASTKSSRLIQFCLSTTSLSMRGIIAQPPPNVNAPILKNDMNSFRYRFDLIVSF